MAARPGRSSPITAERPARLLALLCAAACASPQAQRDAGPPPVVRDAPQDVLSADLTLDLATQSGVATLRVQPATGASQVVLDAHGLSVVSVSVAGRLIEPPPKGTDGLLRVPVDSAVGPVMVVVHYAFPSRSLETFDGWLPEQGFTVTWPSSCGNLYPCNPDPADGVTVTMSVTGVPAGMTAIHPRSTFTDGPAYMPAVAVGTFAQLPLGRTSAGTEISAWYAPDLVSSQSARAGTAHLTAVFDFLERTYGPYPFGPEAGSVSVDWGDESYGGIETHPFSHVAKFDFGTEEVHAHEAAHGWFGNGVRLACWEDFVLSEGTVTYMAARALTSVGGPDVWPMYIEELDAICADGGVNSVVLPQGCGKIDLLADLFSMAPYMKGACFYEEVADLIGWARLDGLLRDFYASHVGHASRMEEMLAALSAPLSEEERRTVERLANEWLRTAACPADYARRCGTHRP